MILLMILLQVFKKSHGNLFRIGFDLRVVDGLAENWFHFLDLLKQELGGFKVQILADENTLFVGLSFD